jgi:electron transport complex protein RnfG
MTDERKELPVSPVQAYQEEAAGPAFETDAGPHPEVEDVPSWRLIATLAVAGALAGLLIVGVFQWAQPQILEYRARVLTDAIGEVLGAPERVQTLYVEGDRLVAEPPAGVDTVTAEKVYLGYDEAGQPVGYAIVGAEPGFQDVIQLIFGYDPGTEQVLGMRVLESKETPGLGDKIMKDLAFVGEFDGVASPIEGVKEPTGAAEEVDMITGATISSRAVIDIINHRLEDLSGILGAAGPGAASAVAPAAASPAPAMEGGAE